MSKVGETKTNSFGSKMTIIEYRKYNDIDVYFPEYDWIFKHTSYQNFRNGKIKCVYEPRVYGIGYLGEGKYKASENNKSTKVHYIWVQMLRRCYDKNLHTKCPTYIGCTVCDEWHNFQNFAEWYEENYYEVDNEIMNLDKDILTKGNKIYSPDTCVFVPQSINVLFTKNDARRGDFPIGIYYNKRCKKYVAQCKIYGKEMFLGYYNTPEEAFQAYKQYKEEHIKKIADNYINFIPENLYNAMISYEINYND